MEMCLDRSVNNIMLPIWYLNLDVYTKPKNTKDDVANKEALMKVSFHDYERQEISSSKWNLVTQD